MIDNLMTYGEVAKILKVCERTVWNLVNSGTLKACKIASSVRIAKEDLQEYLLKSRIKK
jgi:excisionase family DNA binding protein